MQQLSLFDFGAEPPKNEKKKKTSKSEKTPEIFPEKTVLPEADEPKPETLAGIAFSTDFIVEELEAVALQDKKIKDDNLIFADDKIGVKIKTFNLPEEETSVETEITAEPENTEPEEKIPAKKRGRKSFKEIDNEVDLINVPPDEELFQKQYYPISVVAKWFRVNTSLLRFWENQFKILKPKKNKKGDRFFRPEDVKNLQIIYYLLRQKKLTIDGANKHLKAHKQHTEENLQLIQSLNNFKSFLLELKANV